MKAFRWGGWLSAQNSIKLDSLVRVPLHLSLWLELHRLRLVGQHTSPTVTLRKTRFVFKPKMSGMEIVGLANACIGMTRFIFEMVQAARNASGLPDEIEELFQQLPMVKLLFEESRARLCTNKAKHAGVLPILEQCERNLRSLATLFSKICAKEDSHHAQRVWKATWAKMSGRMSELQRLWRDLDGSLTLLKQAQVFDLANTLDLLVQKNGRGNAA